MKYLFNLVCLFIVQKWAAFDRWLCWKLPWFIRLPWCALWVREDEFHPSLEIDVNGMLSKLAFRRTLLRLWMDITRLRPHAREPEIEDEHARLKNLSERLMSEYYASINQRRKIAHLRDEKTPSLL